jgi:hypothetical protein
LPKHRALILQVNTYGSLSKVTIAAPGGGWGPPPGVSGVLSSGVDGGLAGTGHQFHEFAFDGVLVVKQTATLPADDIEARLAESFLLNGPPGVPRIDPDLVPLARLLTLFGIET